eukprot:4771847-Pyramimonas_sp.AAC.1
MLHSVALFRVVLLVPVEGASGARVPSCCSMVIVRAVVPHSVSPLHRTAQRRAAVMCRGAQRRDAET